MDWEKVELCKHANTTDYVAMLSCECGSFEYHCRDCGVYFNDCRCGEQVGMSGWPITRWRKHWRRRAAVKLGIAFRGGARWLKG